MKKFKLIKENFGKRIIIFALSGILSLTGTGCAENAKCNIPDSHVHLYTKNINGLSLQKYLFSERVMMNGYERCPDYIVVTKEDEEVYELLDGTFDGVTNWDYLFYQMANHHDYLKYYWEYWTTQTYTVTDSNGKTSVKTRRVRHSGWGTNPNYSANTGEVRLYHHRYFGYKVVLEDGKYKLRKSRAVDDIREIIYEYPYFSEDCITKVYSEYRFNKNELSNLSPEDFNVFEGPDLSSSKLDNSRIKNKTK